MRDLLLQFSTELRRKCLQRGSIAQTCKSTGINRQQFNKYLAGQILPSARNLRKICSYLGVTEAELIASPAPPAEIKSLPRPVSTATDYEIDFTQLSSRVAERFAAASGADSTDLPANDLTPGFYDCYVPLFADSGYIVRWLLSVKKAGTGLVFSSRTYVQDANERPNAATRNSYHGIGIAGTREAYLVGTSRMQLHQPGILAVNLRPAVEANYFSGLALTPRTDGPVAMIAALRFRGADARAREAVAGLGILRLSDPALDQVIVRLMHNVPAAGANWCQSPLAKNPRTDAPAEGFDDSLLNDQRRFAV